jgi:hypothetical protein
LGSDEGGFCVAVKKTEVRDSDNTQRAGAQRRGDREGTGRNRHVTLERGCAPRGPQGRLEQSVYGENAMNRRQQWATGGQVGRRL